MPVSEGGESLLGIIQNAKPEQINDVLQNLEKYEKILDRVSGMIDKLNRVGVLPAILRVIGAKTGIDVDKPLPTNNPLSIIAKTPIHFAFYRKLNALPEQEISAVDYALTQAANNAKPKVQKKSDKSDKSE